jgi:hypothetical protein
MNTEIDHELTNEMVCPYCGYENIDSQEYRYDEGLAICDKCEKEFYYFRQIDVSYTTRQCSCANGDAPHQWRSQAIEFDDGEILLKGLYRCNICQIEKTFPNETRKSFGSYI